eukprot:TRINITY_DN80912_c0_g1_i1.p1 TRINITY_DN80912_c0_g1~~TRINITY_DN80912_c0_g1_i1.p1  ORF type:complete len:103 (-),score=6.39 TRINITY_DN80912_c0_g1_i1:152-460(-)
MSRTFFWYLLSVLKHGERNCLCSFAALVRFQHDGSVGQRPLGVQFRDLDRCARDRWAKVRYYEQRDANQAFWGPIFTKDLLELEERHLFSILVLLGQIYSQE